MENINLPNEIWKPIIGFDNKYEVSNFGRVLSKHFNTKKVLKQTPNRLGYQTVCLVDKPKNKLKTVHSLVASAFLNNKLNKPQVNHKDGNKLNNNLQNLEWVTSSENIIHAFKFGFKVPTYKKVIDEQNGQIYESALFVSKLINVKYSTFKDWINPKSCTKNKTTFRYLN